MNKELSFSPEDKESLEPATDEQKEAIVSLVDHLLKGKQYEAGIPNTNERRRGMHAVLADGRVANIFQLENNPEGLVAMILLVQWLHRFGGPRNLTNYHIKKTPLDFRVEKKFHYDENKIDLPPPL